MSSVSPDPDEIDEEDCNGYNGAYARYLRHEASGLPFDEWKAREEVELARRNAIRAARLEAELDRVLAAITPSAPKQPQPDQRDPVSDDDEEDSYEDDGNEDARLEREEREAPPEPEREEREAPPDEIDEEAYQEGWEQMRRHKASGLPYNEWKAREEVELAERNAVRAARREAEYVLVLDAEYVRVFGLPLAEWKAREAEELDRVLAAITPSAHNSHTPEPTQKDPVSDDDDEDTYDEDGNEDKQVAFKERTTQPEPEPNPSKTSLPDDDLSDEIKIEIDARFARLLECRQRQRPGDRSAEYQEELRAKITRDVLDKRKADAEEAELLELCSSDRWQYADPAEWVVDQLVLDKHLTIAAGLSGARKSFVGISMALCVAQGIPWLGQNTIRGRCLMVSLEGSAIDGGIRSRGFASGHGTSLPDIGGLFILYPHTTLHPDKPESWKEFLRIVRRMKPRLIVIDNLTHMCGIRSQAGFYDPAVLASVLGPVAALAQGRYEDDDEFPIPATAMLVLAHNNQKGSIQGADAVKLHTDFLFYVTAGAANDHSAPVVLRTDKCRIASDVEELKLRIITGKDPAAYGLRPGDKGALTLELLGVKRFDQNTQADNDDSERKAPDREAQLLSLLPMSTGDLYKAMTSRFKCGRTAVGTTRKKLESEGVIAQRDGKWCRLGIDNPSGA